MTPSDEAIYAQVAAEIAAGFVRPGLWTMALAKAGYDEASAKALYIELRSELLRQELNEAVQAQPVPTALERISVHLDHQKAVLVAETRKRKQKSEDERLEKWKRGIATARRHLENPVPLELYKEKHKISESEIHEKVSKGTLRAYRTEGEDYIDDSSEDDVVLMEKPSRLG